jgi:hypothetical protein
MVWKPIPMVESIALRPQAIPRTQLDRETDKAHGAADRGGTPEDASDVFSANCHRHRLLVRAPRDASPRVSAANTVNGGPARSTNSPESSAPSTTRRPSCRRGGCGRRRGRWRRCRRIGATGRDIGLLGLSRCHYGDPVGGVVRVAPGGGIRECWRARKREQDGVDPAARD